VDAAPYVVVKAVAVAAPVMVGVEEKENVVAGGTKVSNVSLRVQFAALLTAARIAAPSPVTLVNESP
jgi:hypothetical protein